MILVLDGKCGETSCIPNPCPDCEKNWVIYENEKKSILDPAVCGIKNKGRRLRQSAFGDSTCECAGHLGFIEAKQSCSKGKAESLRLNESPKCYHEFLQVRNLAISIK